MINGLWSVLQALVLDTQTMCSGRLALTGLACRMEGTGGGGATVNVSREAPPGTKLVAQLALMCHRFYSGKVVSNDKDRKDNSLGFGL